MGKGRQNTTWGRVKHDAQWEQRLMQPLATRSEIAASRMTEEGEALKKRLRQKYGAEFAHSHEWKAHQKKQRAAQPDAKAKKSQNSRRSG